MTILLLQNYEDLLRRSIQIHQPWSRSTEILTGTVGLDRRPGPDHAPSVQIDRGPDQRLIQIAGVGLELGRFRSNLPPI